MSLCLFSEMETHPTLEGFNLEWVSKIDNRGSANVSRIIMENHVGTHVDVPYHFINKGKTMEEIELSRFMGESELIEVPPGEEVNEQLFSTRYSGKEVVLFKFYKESYKEGRNYFNTEIKNTFAKNNINLVGVNTFSVDKAPGEAKVHRAFLKNDILIVEGLNLKSLEGKFYYFICLPLALKGAEGSPARAVLITS